MERSGKNEILSFEDILKQINHEEKSLMKLLQHGNKHNIIEDTKYCTYKKGYISQEVFACKTCYFRKYDIPTEIQSTKDWILKCNPVSGSLI